MRLLRTILLTTAALCSFYLLTGCQDSKKTEPDQTTITEPIESKETRLGHAEPGATDTTPPKVDRTPPVPKPKETTNKGLNQMKTGGGWFEAESYEAALGLFTKDHGFNEYWQPCKECNPET